MMEEYMEYPERASACGLAAAHLLESYRPEAVAHTWMVYLEGLMR